MQKKKGVKRKHTYSSLNRKFPGYRDEESRLNRLSPE